MTNEAYTPATPEDQTGMPAAAARSFEVYQTTIDHFLETADQRRVFGEPIQHGDHIIIPASEVMAGMAFGVGSGGMMRPQEEHGGGFGTGGGGGGNTFSRPVAVIVADAKGVQVIPVMDRTKILLTALTAFGFMVATIGRFRRGPRE